MNRIKAKFKSLDRTALVTFIMAGDPGAAESMEILKGLPTAGADLIEIGMPFTDPAADGVSIQKAGQRALAAGMTLKGTLDMVSLFRESDNETPIILMGYTNPLYAYGLEDFARDASQAGVDGLIIVDLPPEEDGVLREHVDQYGLNIIRLVTPVTDDARLQVVLDGASGFLYYVSITGVTGTAKADFNDLKPHLEAIREQTDLPIAIGFGIKTPEDAKAMSEIGDAIVVGSAIVDRAHDMQETLDFVGSLSSAL